MTTTALDAEGTDFSQAREPPRLCPRRQPVRPASRLKSFRIAPAQTPRLSIVQDAGCEAWEAEIDGRVAALYGL